VISLLAANRSIDEAQSGLTPAESKSTAGKKEELKILRG